MSLGVERFLILGCIAVVVLEIPNLIGDVESATVQNKVVEQMIAERAADAAAIETIQVASGVVAEQPVDEVLVALRTDELLPSRPGL
jgi:hypothetical protein